PLASTELQPQCGTCEAAGTGESAAECAGCFLAQSQLSPASALETVAVKNWAWTDRYCGLSPMTPPIISSRRATWTVRGLPSTAWPFIMHAGAQLLDFFDNRGRLCTQLAP